MKEGKEEAFSPVLTIRRAAWALAGILWFLWIGYEDRDLTAVLVLSAAITISIGFELYLRWGTRGGKGKLPSFLWGTAIGGISGTLVIPIAFLLASMKTSLHQHEAADFSADDFIILVDRLLVWVIAGMLIGAGMSFLARIPDDKT